MAAISNFVKNDVKWQTEKPYIYAGPERGFPTTNMAYEEGSLNLLDIRSVPQNKRPTVDSHGFCYAFHNSKELPALQELDEQASKPYGNEMAVFLKALLGAEKVIPVQVRMRSARKEENRGSPGTEAHMDTTPHDAFGRMYPALSQEEQQLVLSGEYRARIMNLWRPMKNHAEDFPLAVLDPDTLNYERDGMPLDHVTPISSAETVYLKCHPSHRWYWMSNQSPDEVIVFTQYDTHPPNGKFNQIGHAAFKNGAARDGCPPRRSVEVRFIVLDPAATANPETTAGKPRPLDPRKQPWRDFVDLPENPMAYKPTFSFEDRQAIEA